MPRSPGPENGITWGKVAKARQSMMPWFGRVFCSGQCWRFDSTWRAGWVMMVVGVIARRLTFVACLTCQFVVTRTVVGPRRRMMLLIQASFLLLHILDTWYKQTPSTTTETLAIPEIAVIMASSKTAGQNAVWKEPTKEDKPSK
jgi:hypothetical protein